MKKPEPPRYRLERFIGFEPGEPRWVWRRIWPDGEGDVVDSVGDTLEWKDDPCDEEEDRGHLL